MPDTVQVTAPTTAAPATPPPAADSTGVDSIQADVEGIADLLMPGIKSLQEPRDPETGQFTKKEDSSAAEEPQSEAEKELTEKEARSQWHARLAKLDAREKKLSAKVDKLKDQAALVQAAEKSLAADLTVLTRGDGAQVLEALSRITKRDPVQLYEQISLAVLGKKPEDSKASRELAEMKERLEAAEAEMKAEKESRHMGAIRSAKREELIAGMQDASQWPLLAQYAAKDANGTFNDVAELYKQECESAGGWLDTDVVLDRIERRLRSNGLAGTDKPAAGSGPGRVPDSRNENQAVARQRPPTSIPTSSASANSTRELADEERLNPDLYGDVLADLGL